MPRSHTSTSPRTANGSSKRRKSTPFRVLVVDDDARSRKATLDAVNDDRLICFAAANVAEARQLLAGGPMDVALISLDLPDDAGIDLLNMLRKQKQPPHLLVSSKSKRFDAAVNAMRLGAADYLPKPLAAEDVRQRIDTAVQRCQHERKKDVRLRRLRRACHKLNEARQEITQQVDVLCNDLVTAYQELATQMQQVVQTSEYTAIVRKELDLEQLLRRTLEHVLEKAGATNAALFLPSSMDEYSLGGYINYDQANGSPDFLLQHLADIVAPQIAHRDELLHVTDNETISQWIGDDADYLEDCHMLASPCVFEDECLAVFVLFRDSETPYDAAAVETLTAISPVLAEHLARIIRVHHRCVVETEFEGPDEELPF